MRSIRRAWSSSASSFPPHGTRCGFAKRSRSAIDPGSDLALLKIGGDALPALRLRDSDGVKEGQAVLFTGFPIGAALGPYPATHRGMVSAITPIAIPQARSAELNPKVIRRLTSGSFPIFQLDATAYPGNSGSPVYDPESGEVLGIVNMVFVKGTKETALTQPSGITYAMPGEPSARPAAKGSPLIDPYWLKALVKALVLPPTGPLLVAALGLGLLRRAPRVGRLLAFAGVLSLLLLVVPAVSDLLRQCVGGSPLLDLERAKSAQAIVILGGGTRRDAPEYGGDTLGH